MTSKINKPFLQFVGKSWINGKAVVAYGDETIVQLRAETTGFKHVPGTTVVEMPREQYEALREGWMEGCLNADDSRVQQRALNYLGLDI